MWKKNIYEKTHDNYTNYTSAPQITVFHLNLALYKFHYLLTYYTADNTIYN